VLDLEPATHALGLLVKGVRDDQLTASTPCSESSLGALLDHIDGLAQAFAAGARKTVPNGGSQAPSADAVRLGADWRTRIPARLEVLGQAWNDEDAWTGVADVGGLESPGAATGMFALDEVIVHGWDVSMASGQPFALQPDLLAAVHDFVRNLVADQPNGIPGLFGPAVSVPAGAPLLDRLVGLTGRDPHWTPSQGAK
jgi:uncharacterized protein (TIGR03086 family)